MKVAILGRCYNNDFVSKSKVSFLILWECVVKEVVVSVRAKAPEEGGWDITANYLIVDYN